MNEAKNDPKADLIRDMVVSISKIPDRFNVRFIFRNVLIMDRFLISTLAQLLEALLRWVKAKEEYNTLEIVKVKILPTRKS
jgi:DNA primase